MEIYATHASRKIRHCGGKPDLKYGATGCGGPIDHKAPIVVGSWWRNKRKQHHYFHLECYIDGLRLTVERIPYRERNVGHNGGRPAKLQINPDQRKLRKSLATRMSKLMRERDEIYEYELPGYQETSKENRAKIEVLVKLYKENGGVPSKKSKNWSWFI